MKPLIIGIAILISTNCGNNTKNSTTANNEFVWDFSEPKTYVYSYVEKDNSKGDKAVMRAPKMEITQNGQLQVAVNENKLANLSLTDLQAESILYDDTGKATDTLYSQDPALVVQGMKPNGTFERDDHFFTFDVFFPLPTKKLEVGETDKVSIERSVAVNGLRASLKGFINLEYTGNEQLEGHDVAVLKGTIDISDLEMPGEINFEASSVGKAIYYFDLKNRYFVGADIQISSKTIETIREKTSFLQIDQDIKLRLEKIEE